MQGPSTGRGLAPAERESPKSPPAEPRDGICVLGMHRSGTSLTAGVLSRLGVFLGDRGDLQPPDGANPLGYWELPEITALNDELLEQLGGTWASLPPLPAGWADSSELEPLRKRARRLLDERFSGVSTWGWKDPRNSVTLPFWEPLVPDLRYVICVRNPVDVAQSLRAIDDDGAALDRHLANWLRYTALALENTSGCPRLIVDYDDLVSEREATVGRLARFVDLEERASDPEVQRALEEFVDPTLALFRTSTDLDFTDERASRETIALYRELRRVARVDSTGDREPEAQAREWQSIERLAHRLLTREDAGGPERSAEAGGPAADRESVEVRPADDRGAKRVAELEGAVQEKQHALGERDSRLTALEDELREERRARGEAERLVAKLRERISAAEASNIQHDADRVSLEKRLRESKQRLEAATSQAEGLEAKIAQGQERTRKLEAAVEAERGRLKQREGELADRQGQVAELEGRLERAGAASAETDSRAVEAERRAEETAGQAEEAEGRAEGQRRLVADRDALIARLQARVTELEQVAARELEQVADRDERLVSTQSEIADLLGHVERLKAAVEERDARLQAQKRFLQEQREDFHLRDAQHQQMMRMMRESRSWRVTRPYRRTAIFFRGMTGRGDSDLKP